MLKAHETGPRMLAVALAAALAAGPARAAPPAGAELAAWIAGKTDLMASQIAVVGPDNVYSLEPLGPRSSTGEVIALVRTEAFSDTWGAAHGFQSWDANLLIDCAGGRLRVIRSARYPERNRQGRPVADAPDKDWTTPGAGAPSAKLVAAACDPAFAWPLRAILASNVAAAAPASQGKLPEVVEMPGPKSAAAAVPGGNAPAGPDAKPAADVAGATLPAAPTPAAAVAEAKPAVPPAESKAQVVVPEPEGKAQVVTPAAQVAKAASGGPPLHAPPGVAGPFALQIVQGPSESDARKILAAAHAAVGPAAGELGETVQKTTISRGRVRYLAFLTGFASEDAAASACQALQAKKQDCAVRSAAPAPVSPPSAPPAAKVAEAHDGLGRWFVQVGRGPSEEGARKALDSARRTLGQSAEGLTSTMDSEQLGPKRRYTARLEGFPSEAAAQAACEQLSKARQTCFYRPMPRRGAGL